MNRLEDQNQNLFYVVKVKLLYFPFICCKEIILSKSTLPAVKQLLATKIFIKYQKIKNVSIISQIPCMGENKSHCDNLSFQNTFIKERICP